MTSFLAYYRDFRDEQSIETDRKAVPSDEDFSKFKAYKQFKLHQITEINKKNSRLAAAKTQRLKQLEDKILDL